MYDKIHPDWKRSEVSGMYCVKCGIELPGDAVFCYKCGTPAQQGKQPIISTAAPSSEKIIAPYDAKVLKCPSCGAPISPKFGEMMIVCEYCDSCVTLGNEGWKSIQKHTMLPLKVSDQNVVISSIRDLMSKGIFRWKVQEHSTLEEINLTYVPYWIISVSARTNIVASDTAAQVGTVAATAAVLGAMSGGRGGRRGGGLVEGALLGSMMAGGMGAGGMKKAFQMNEIHNYPVVAIRALTEYQPHDFEFALQDRVFFDATKVPKGLKIFNGDVGENDAKQQAKTLVDQLQSQKAHKKYHMIQQINTEIDIGEAELLHVPVWFVKYKYKDDEIILVVDGYSGDVIHTVGIKE